MAKRKKTVMDTRIDGRRLGDIKICELDAIRHRLIDRAANMLMLQLPGAISHPRHEEIKRVIVAALSGH